MKKKNEIPPLKEIMCHLKSSSKRCILDKNYSRVFNFDMNKIEEILFSKRSCLTVNFYDCLILNDEAEFLKRFYWNFETHMKLPKIYDHWHSFYKLYPNNYTDLKICKYIFRNIKNKQNLLNLNHLNLSKDSLETDTNEIFNSSVLKELIVERILPQSISSDKRISIIKDTDNAIKKFNGNNNKDKQENSFDSVENFVNLIEKSEKIYMESKKKGGKPKSELHPGIDCFNSQIKEINQYLGSISNSIKNENYEIKPSLIDSDFNINSKEKQVTIY